MRTLGRFLILVLALTGCFALTGPAATADPVTIDETTAREIDDILAQRAATPGLGKADLVELLSRKFLGTPYGANMLIGSASRPEQLVIDFRRVDCFTYLDYAAALADSTTRDDFVANLIRTRYTDGRVEFTQRRHFFTDWSRTPKPNATDITATLTPRASTITKDLNAKADGSTYLPGLPVVRRAITYIPSESVDADVLAQLHNGDYIGAYTPQPGLDVTHVGIYTTTPTGPALRNASSLTENNKVVDSPFLDYLRTIPGIVVLRAQ
ncbi:DUF1460 domain-containing protein [Nocardia bovistercoris]|uniref:DUF1460 domain-containing protein n=1 Tax=Nocardia bovistercoris TaxID=2785916 RepID=A0A931IA37_9NOCA|nr:DUF1460 domain-containing protein [Nocardia bovistercoris]MBH0776125.1 DUF1460 domain-containing protein [Nocardia bovistercoris]